ncbi:S1-C subfamily serine protease [Bradyrhizobium japonicum]|uniref:S1 family peptidase n=2 Tax=Bradyrhizobium japonicum TaxID=375 RepID=UPI00209E6E0B|nr:serine protease [Bradyrhizobium japonicum]MCP1760016.1 S1-C subfamily serine protease [Bradyrhizobium japonicum]MCP1791608.1 S1-C subfamily serine protease [Bradyrhizobium japonicum]MCP1804028.1 S1-C subfamily serine protease [Bradyrhizobium japonicum]MCP1813051.1 S1-C subfamily serine protease [Bradyrhizobium japonicum]MCP1875528.1 S1-C subfamily serine protease [Bradyrhizobium japonicum]
MKLVSRRSALAMLGAAIMTPDIPEALAEETVAAEPLKIVPLEQVQHATVIIRCVNKAGQNSSGTGFLFAFFKHEGREVQAVVTNKHVIAGAEKGVFRWTLKNSSDGPDYGKFHDVVYEKDFEKGWLAHPDPTVDLAIFLLGNTFEALAAAGSAPYGVFADEAAIPTGELFKDLLPLEDVLVVGYPDGISDIRNNIPVFRRGITATPVNIDFEGRKEFLIDAAIYPGSSGSPVFVYNQGSWLNRKNEVQLGTRLMLVGVVYGVAQHSVNGELMIVPAPTQKQVAISLVPNNLGICIKSSRILEFEPLMVSKGFPLPSGYNMRAK